MLTELNWEDQINSRLKRFGLHVQASHERGGGYICIKEGCKPRWFSNLYKLQNFVEKLEYRYAK